MAAPRASSGVHSEAGLEGGRDLHPVVATIGAAQIISAKKRFSRIRISGLMIQPGAKWKPRSREEVCHSAQLTTADPLTISPASIRRLLLAVTFLCPVSQDDCGRYARRRLLEAAEWMAGGRRGCKREDLPEFLKRVE